MYKLINGDCVTEIKNIETESIDYSIFSPPFAELYVYSDSIYDMGNSKDYNEYFQHFNFLVPDLHRVIKSGRLISIHCIDLPLMKEKDGFIGLRDFPGDIIKTMVDNDFIYHSRHTIWKDPLIEVTRTKARGLLHKSIMKDSAMVRAGLPDYLLTFRKRGENAVPIKHDKGFTDFYGINEPDVPKNKIEYSHQVWRKYASPIWMDINQTNTLNIKTRDERDEKHICPLQLDVISRGLELWSNPGETILSPFAGIGSEGYQAILHNRNFIGIELKKSYYDQAVINLNNAEQIKKQKALF